MPSEHKYALPRGSRLRQYVIARLLGHGGFGLTYLAEDTRLNRKVAIKELFPIDFAARHPDGVTVVARSHEDKGDLEWALRRFIEEARTLASLHHPSILPIYEILEEHGTAYLVTGFVEGENLEEWLRGVGQPAEKELRAITLSLLEALEVVHESGYLHRDVKPQNILMDRLSGSPILIDFGNARIATGAKTANMTAVLTKGYAPFEQYQTKGRQGPFTDFYALGAVLYRAITGAAPEDATDRLEQDKVEPLRRRPPPGYSREFLATVDKALQMRRENRWQNSGEWKAAIKASEPPVSRKSERSIGRRVLEEGMRTLRRVPIPASKHSPLIVALAALASLAVVGVGIGLLGSHFFSTPNPPAIVNADPQLSSIPAVSPVVSPTPNSVFPPPRPAVALPSPTPHFVLPPFATPRGMSLESASADHPYVNSLRQEFVPVPGTNVLFCRWDTRVSDWESFIQEEGDTEQPGIVGFDEKDGKIWFGLKPGLNWKNPGFPQTDRNPVVGVSWNDARRFCAWLSKKENRVYRLPTDAEWSAAVGPQKYPWGNTLPPPKGSGNYGDITYLKSLSRKYASDFPNYNDGYLRTSPVGSFAPNRYGLYDMGGNVWQWCEDEYRTSMNSADILARFPKQQRETAPDGTRVRTARGGSWSNFVECFVRSSYRDGVHPANRVENLGFRCVLVVSGS